ncbi:Unknown protein [Striga hermonthica]|uniref:Uncharacterized protein n=1 Tax=Striga hermonthica TaxID=68872 RepID=A0A9N7N4A0_STRHE|nr:Unknown protein [Striga hermonthica]
MCRSLIENLIEPAEKVWWQSVKTRPPSGRLGLKLEGADGKFDQLRPLHRLKGHRVLYSFDLKAATDMLPKNLTGSILKGLFGEEMGVVWFDIMNETAFRSPIMVPATYSALSANAFSVLGIRRKTNAFRLKGAGYRPHKGILGVYEYGVARAFLLRKAKPPALDEESVEMIRPFWEGREDLLERFLSTWVGQHVRYLEWYADACLNYSLRLEDLLDAPVCSSSISRISEEKLLTRYGVVYECWDYLRKTQVPIPITANN